MKYLIIAELIWAFLALTWFHFGGVTIMKGIDGCDSRAEFELLIAAQIQETPLGLQWIHTWGIIFVFLPFVMMKIAKKKISKLFS